MMRLVSIALALAALGAALVAAWQWYRVSRSVQDPLRQRDLQLDSLGRDSENIRSITISAPFYKAAAVWTGICVVLGALSSVAGAFSLSLTAASPVSVASAVSTPIAPTTETALNPSPRLGGGGGGNVFAVMRQACSADFQRACPDAKPGGGAIAACIKQNRQGFSDTCKSAIAEMQATWRAQSGPRAAMRQACMTDFQKLCPDAKPGPGGAIAACIRQNHDSFSDPCKTAIAQMRSQQQAQRNAGPGPTADPDLGQ